MTTYTIEPDGGYGGSYVVIEHNGIRQKRVARYKQLVNARRHVERMKERWG